MIYEPKEDSLLLQKYVLANAKNKIFLDMGSGSGIQAEAARKAHAKHILAIDVSQDSVDLLKEKKIKSIQSNLFQNVKEKFDLIAFNPPYLPEDKREDKESKTITAGGINGDEMIVSFLKKAPQHMNENGKILLILSSLTPRRKIEQTLRNQNLKKAILEKQKFFMETLECWEITN